MKFKFSKP